MEFQSELREGTENALAEEVQVTLEQRAEDSFKDINDPNLIVHPFKKNLKAAKVWDVYPDQSLYPNKYAHLVLDNMSFDVTISGLIVRFLVVRCTPFYG